MAQPPSPPPASPPASPPATPPVGQAGNPEVITVTGARRRSIGDGPVAFPDFSIELVSDGGNQPLAADIGERMIRVAVSEKRGEAADQLDLVLDDSDGRLALPPVGARLAVSLGWLGGGGTTKGLVGKGTFTVDEVTAEGPSDTITIRARSADFTGGLRQVRTEVWTGRTVGQIVRTIASRHGLTPVIANELASVPAGVTDQRRQSDLAFLRRLGTAHDAVATIKSGRLLFAPAGQGRSASGREIPVVTIARAAGDRWSWRIEARQRWAGVTASWRDRGAARNSTVTAGNANPGPGQSVKRLRRRYATEAQARQAAQAEWRRLNRVPQQLNLSLALGRPEIGPETPVTVTGFKAAINETSWVVTEARHQLDNRGLVSSLTLDVRSAAR